MLAIERLFVYGTLQPGQPNEHELASISGEWSKAQVRGRLVDVGWGAYLADLHARGAEIPAYAAPARNTDYSDFPPTMTFVGTLEQALDKAKSL